MNNLVVINIIRFIFFFLIQILLFKRLSSGWEGWIYVNVLIYPLFLFLLPLSTPKPLMVFLGFVIGLAVDVGYGTYGVNAGASVFTAYLRSYVLNWTEPREGYAVNASPNINQLGGAWFFRYAGILMLVHTFIYFCIDAFSPVFILDILAKTIYTFIFSMLGVLIVMFLFNPKN
jgi:hypothetical protein